jgi:hypothetical protein
MKKIRAGALCIWLIILSGIILAFLRHNEWVYSLPTIIPKNYLPLNNETETDISAGFPFREGKSLFLHFFNPDFAYSGFNIPSFKLLAKKNEDEGNFAPVIGAAKNDIAEQIQERFSLNLPVLVDNSLVVLRGVYSTPQTVIPDKNHYLFYCGNYYWSGYCTDEKSNYAQIVLDGPLRNNLNLIFSQFALQAYGCQLPNCTLQ